MRVDASIIICQSSSSFVFHLRFACIVLIVVDAFPLVSALLVVRPTITGHFQLKTNNYNDSNNKPRITLHQKATASSLTDEWNDSIWVELEERLGKPYSLHLPHSIDSVLDPRKPNFSTERPTLFRERHGWCPYSERVWLALELLYPNVTYDTVRIDNTGGPRPSYFAGQTPQILWPENNRRQGESMDLVQELDRRYGNTKFQCDSQTVQTVISKFTSIFPRSRPSSRAAFLFQMNGEPLWKSTFEETLKKTNELLSQNSNGPFFCGSDLTAADIAWAPFLERYRYQLPCLHNGLDPYNNNKQYPFLSQWYQAMDQIPVYACRVKGNASSWRKVLSMAGFGNSGVPPQIQSNMDALSAKEESEAQDCIDLKLWSDYAKDRPYVASTPHEEACASITRNRKAIIQDIVKQSATKSIWRERGLPDTLETANDALKEMVEALLFAGANGKVGGGDMLDASSSVGILASFLDERMCVPRDMGAMTASTIKNLAVSCKQV